MPRLCQKNGPSPASLAPAKGLTTSTTEVLHGYPDPIAIPPDAVLDLSLANQPTVDISRLWRAHVLPQEWCRADRTVFIEALSERGAHERIVHAIAAIDHCSIQNAAERVCNLTNARQCIEEGMSDDREGRLFEIAWAAAGQSPSSPSRYSWSRNRRH